ncbi:MAG: hypothetical protein K8S54_03760 [Spirochaetia bacterium]|nr:hypothetical protein [Spirochaetia bacterium]
MASTGEISRATKDKLYRISSQVDWSDLGREVKTADLVKNETWKAMITRIPLPATVLVEDPYVDYFFRDTYYAYFSGKHSPVSRDCIRLSIFQSIDIEWEDFFSVEGQKRIQESFVGLAILRDLRRPFGRLLLDARKLNLPEMYVRLTEYEVVIRGVHIAFQSYPFASQDGEMMTCAETTLWSIADYYGHRYPEYKISSPSEIQALVKRTSFERTIPSTGLNYMQITSVLREMGFSPKVYSRFTNASSTQELYPDGKFHRILHYYVESGIPIIVGITGGQNGKPYNHAVVFVGHKANDITNRAPRNTGSLCIVDAIPDDYVMMNDNLSPFELSSFSAPIPGVDESRIKYIIVPLYKRIHLEAAQASDIFHTFLSSPDHGIKMDDKLSLENPLVLRIFLTSSRKYKSFRATRSNRLFAKHLLDLPLPKFIWVAELSTRALYASGKACGELILDATESINAGQNSLLMVHYPGSSVSDIPTNPLLICLKR